MPTSARLFIPLLLLSGTAGSQQAAPPPLDVRAPALSRPGDGSPVCGLGKAFHAGRRAALRAKLGKGLILVRGLPDTRDYVNFRQDRPSGT